MFGFLALSKTHGLKLIEYLLNTKALLYPQRLTKPPTPGGPSNFYFFFKKKNNNQN
jgi:hypothetical protein